jgi:hypothetical protein
MPGKKRWIGRPLWVERTQGLRRTPARKGSFTDGLFVTLTTTTTALTRSVPQVCHQAKRQRKTLPQWSIDRCPKSKRSKMGPALCEGIHEAGAAIVGGLVSGTYRHSPDWYYLFLSVIFSVEASDAERLINMNWSGQADLDEMRRCAEHRGPHLWSSC